MAQQAPLTEHQLKLLLEKLNDEHSHTVLRNRALVLVMADARLRPGEALSLKTGDFDSIRGTLRVRGHEILLGSWAAEALREWVRVKGEGELLFPTAHGGPMHDSYLRSLLYKLSRQAGLERPVAPDHLRHWRANLERGGEDKDGGKGKEGSDA